MNVLLMSGLCAGVALGLLLIIQGFRGRKIVPHVSAFFPKGTSAGAATAWFVGGVILALLITGATRWVGAGIGLGVIFVALPWFFGGAKASKREIERTQAIATWTEMIRDNLSGAAGLEQALLATADIAPTPIAKEVRTFANRLDGMNTTTALGMLGSDLDHPAADLVVVSLANAARMEGRDLGSLLTRLADSIRADVNMRQRIEVGRSRIRTSSKIVLGVTMGTVAMMYVTSRDLLSVYDTTQGQFWLIGVFGLFFAALWLMNYFAVVRLPDRFSARYSSLQDEVYA